MTDWIDNLIGAGQTPTVKFILLFAAIIIGVLALIFVARRLLGGTFVSGGRGRHLRLAVMDATPVDSRRRLVLVRRDDVEHLILIGGPTDVVVEQNIRIDGPREAKAAPPVATAAAPAMPSPAPVPARPAPEPAPELARPEPIRPAPPPVQPIPAAPRPQPAIPPLAARPAPALTPAAPLPRPIQPPLQPLRPAQPVAAPQVAPPVIAPRPPLAPGARVEPLPAHRHDPVMSIASAAPAVAAVTAAKPLEDELDESLMADLSESLSFDTAEAVPEVSLEKEMESLLSTLDTQKDRIS